ncbi:MAG: dihydroorotase [Candidatus Omnitrophica bacterium]|nr:dihydroorotase [Candidatus Omnitrophota bacterium]
MKNLLLKNGRVIDPANNIDEVCDILVTGGKIAKVSKGIKDNADETIDATGKIIMPGIVDMHVHLREPGREDKETIATGTRAALRGGVTTMLAMPNTLCAIDCAERVRLLKDIIARTAFANVLISAAITKERCGKELTDIRKLKEEGITAISDDGSSVDSQKLMLEALIAAKKEKLTVTCHCEDISLTNNGVVNLGLTSTRLGLRGISKESEFKRVGRDIELAASANAPIHIAHVSCSESVQIIANAKQKGIRVTAETAPHYISLSEEAVFGYDTNFKMNPPLRAKADVEAIKQALRANIIDVIASDHAPHTENEKEIEFDRAEFGVIGMETELAVSITELIQAGILTWPQLVAKLTTKPAQILGINKGTLSVGADADIAIVNPEQDWLVKKEELISKSKNSPFLGRTLKGVVEYTIYLGNIAYKKTAKQ